MTIETALAPSGGKSPGVGHATGHKGKSGTADASNAGLPTGFMAILAAMDTASVVAEPVIADGGTQTVAGDAAATGVSATAGMPFLAGFNLSPATSAQVNPESMTDTTGVENVSVKSPLAAAVAGVDGVSEQPALAGADVVPTVSMDAAVLAAQSTQAVAIPAESGNTVEEGTAPTSVGGVPAAAKSMRTPVTPGGATSPHDTVGDVASEVPRKVVGKPLDAGARQALADLAQPNQTKSNAQSDAKVQDFMQRVASSQAAPVAVELAVASAVSSSRREDHSAERSIFKANSTEASYVPQPPTTDLTGNAPVSSASDVASPVDTFVAEQISYWISNDVQNAEMKLDGVGDSPVGVSISMHGNEAHVTFRTDELQAREALENASLHLKDLLQQEGLVLAGVSVGTSGAGDSGGQEPRPRQGAKVAAVVSAPVGAVGRGPVQSGAAGRALDIFV